MTISQFPIPAGGIPTGDTAGRPASPVIGDVYYNGELGILEIFDGTEFIACSAPPTGPTVSSAVDVGTSRDYGSAQVTVTLASGTGGGIPIQYQAVGSLDQLDYESATTTSTTVTLTVGDAGTYSIGGIAINNFGASVTGPTTSVALTTVPQAPTIGTATTSSGTTNVTVTWTLGNNGGKNLTAIEVVPYLNGTTAQTATTAATTTATSAAIAGLSSGSAYTFKVKATNANGTGLESSATNSVTIPIIVEYLVVAGGGGGGGTLSPDYATGGGGAGGFRTANDFTVAVSTNYTVTVGAGGTPGDAGGNSVFSTITSAGGGQGGNTNGSNGGSGGGAPGVNGRTAGNGNTPSTSPSQGNNGGTGTDAGSTAAGGGGGANAVGGNGSGTGSAMIGGNGGAGTASSITGSSVTYAGGGGGGVGYSGGAGQSGGTGGAGGGGDGVTGGNGNNGSANTGGGGGGRRGSTGTSGNGGSGVVILKYTDNLTIANPGGGLTSSTATTGGFSVTTFTAGTGNVSWS